MTGVVYLVGAGPGAGDLLTLRAARLLGEADVVLYDALVGEEALALAKKAKLYNVGKRAGRPSTDQRFICRLLVRLAGRHRTIVRLKGGDPSLFGRAGEELDACRAAGVPVSIVPGVSAGFAAAASLGSSLTLRGIARSVTFVTPATAKHGVQSNAWADAAANAETALVYMGAVEAARVRDQLVSRGVPASRPVALVENASRVTERIVRGTLSELPELAAQLGDGPALMVIGEAVAQAGALARSAAA
ncbi:MAG: uroporphyrinogen-III C-methyltransferase [Hyphomonadaceae bacterium]